MIDPRPFAFRSKWVYTAVPGVNVPPFRAVVDVEEGRVVLAIRGTCDLISAATDVEALPQRVAGLGLVHGGFWRALEAAWPELERALHERDPDIITGHSAGGAWAFLVAAKLCLAGRPPKAVIAFAPARPSIGSELADLLALHGVEVQIYRLGDDQVPNLPPGFALPGPMTQLGRIDSVLRELDDHSITHIDMAVDAYVAVLVALAGSVPA